MQKFEQHQTGTLSAALAAAAELLGTNPALAEKRATAILKSVPGQPQALMLLVSARLAQGDAGGARAMLELAANAQPKLAALHYELGLLTGELGETEAAITALSRVVELEPEHPSAWRPLGDRFADAGRATEAAQAYANHFRSAVNDLKFVEDAAALAADQPALAEGMLNAFLEIHPTDVSTIHMLAQLYLRTERPLDAETLLSRALEMAPGVATVRYDFASALFRQRKWAEANIQLDIVLKQEPRYLPTRALKSVVLRLLGEYEQSISFYEDVLRDDPNNASAWLSYGHTLAAIGRREDSISAYRRSIALQPGLGEAWWSLADLKTFRFTPGDIESMESRLADDGLAGEHRYKLHFALGKALEDRQHYSESFAHYRQGNLIRRAGIQYDPGASGVFMRRSKALFRREFFRERKGIGCAAPDPIFIVGLRRSGSTLVEQILSTHSAIEGTMELPDLLSIAGALDCRQWNGRESSYPEILGSLDGSELNSLGKQYLESTRVHRKLGRPYFVDKLPNNFQHVGLIHLILPNARIIDARRHPLGCCFSNFKQYFAGGVEHSYDLAEVGRYYRDYVELMAHYDAVLPGRVHRVIYEDMVRDPETEIRRLLDYCGVAFEDTCLRFHESRRGVRTPSAEQVRRPMYADSVAQWRNFEPWLAPLKTALGSVLDLYPAAPVFDHGSP
jgi:tetratricopeptide (TPR) repeat protein